MNDDLSTGHDLPTAPDIITRLEELRERIVAVGGTTEATKILAVTKTFPTALVRVAMDAGLLEFGENYGQELEAKAQDLAGDAAAKSVKWHFIGGLQRNKVKRIAGAVSVWQTVDRLSLAQEIARRDPGGSIMVQVNTTNEEQKSGATPADTPMLVEESRNAGLSVIGLMTIGPTNGTDPRPAFSRLRTLADDLGLEERSMGMSGDLELAVAEGSTMVRVGTALFGPRSAPSR